MATQFYLQLTNSINSDRPLSNGFTVCMWNAGGDIDAETNDYHTKRAAAIQAATTIATADGKLTRCPYVMVYEYGRGIIYSAAIG